MKTSTCCPLQYGVLTFLLAKGPAVQQRVGLQESKKDIKPKNKKPSKPVKSRSPASQTNKLEQQFKYGTNDQDTAAEGVQQGVQQFDEEFEARLRGLKQQTQRTLVCFHCTCSSVTRQLAVIARSLL